MHATLLRYRFMANLVGVLLIILICIGVPLEHLSPNGSTRYDIGHWITTVLGTAHGFLYMLFLVSAALLARAARWTLGFTAVTLLCGTIPFASFWAERRATRITRQSMAAVSS